MLKVEVIMRNFLYFRPVFFLIGIFFATLVSFTYVNASTSRTFNYSENDVSTDTLDGYDVVHMPRAPKISQLGAPNLPFYTYSFIIPNNMDVDSVQITYSDCDTLEGKYWIYPAQIPKRTIYPPDDPPFVEPDSIIYSSSNPYPGYLAECIDMGFFDGANKIAQIAVYPLQFTPTDSMVVVYTTISINLLFTSSNEQPVYPEVRSEWGIKIYEDALEGMVINTEDISTYGYIPEVDNNPYVVNNGVIWYPFTIITSEDLAPYYSDFAIWQSQTFISTGIVTVDDITNEWDYDEDEISGIVDTPGAIRQYLYDGWSEHGLQYVFLGGDESKVPVRMAYINDFFFNEIPSDHYYSDLTGDWEVDGDLYYGELPDPIGDDVDYYPEVIAGRLTADSQNGIDCWFNKLYGYVTDPGSGNYDYLFRYLFTQADDLQNYFELDQLGQVQSEWLTGADWWPEFLDATIEEEDDIDCPTRPEGSYIIDEINETGFGWISFYNHGECNYVQIATTDTPGYLNSAIFTHSTFNDPLQIFQGNDEGALNNLTNNENQEWSILYTIACHSATYDYNDYLAVWGWEDPDECISVTEGFTWYNESGGPAAIGNTRYGSLDYSYQLHSWFLQNVWAGGNIIGVSNAASKPLAFTGNTGSHEVILGIALFGSPIMPVWISTPQNFTTISHPLSVSESGNSNFLINTGIEGSLICIYQKNNGYYNCGLTDSQGSKTFEIELTATDSLWVTITYKNYIPYQYTMIPGVPGPPQNLDLSTCGPPDHYPRITWDSNPESDIEGYNIYKNLTSNGQSTGYFKQNQCLITDTTYVDSTFSMSHQGDTRADYTVTAVDEDEHESNPSEDVSTLGFSIDSHELDAKLASVLYDYNGLLVFPNPFNQSVNIQFAIEIAGEVNITLYDIMGRRVAGIFRDFACEYTLHSLTFNADHLSSGIYICQFGVSNKITNQKILLLK